MITEGELQTHSNTVNSKMPTVTCKRETGEGGPGLPSSVPSYPSMSYKTWTFMHG